MTTRNEKMSSGVRDQVNRQNYVNMVGQVGSEIYTPKNIKQENVDQTSTYENFEGPVSIQAKLGGAASATASSFNQVRTDLGNLFEYFIISSGSSNRAHLVKSLNGLDIDVGEGSGEGIEFGQAFLAAEAKHQLVTEQDNKSFAIKMKIADVSDYSSVRSGFRTIGTATQSFGYIDSITVNFTGSAFNLINGNTYMTSLSQTINTGTFTDGDAIELRFEQDYETGIDRACRTVNMIKVLLNQHINDVTIHKEADVDNLIIGSDAYDATSLLALCQEIDTKYTAHTDDARLAAAWVFHYAQEAASSEPLWASPSTVINCHGYAYALVNAYNVHDSDAGVHTTGDEYPASFISPLGNIRVFFSKNGAAFQEIQAGQVAVLSVAAANAIPFLRTIRTSATGDSELALQKWEFKTYESTTLE